MYNGRVEHFNNLLYQDILLHDHAYFIDSNKNLTWDTKMYWKNTGSVNNYGMQIIFEDIADLINYINENKGGNTESKQSENITSPQTTEQFFLL